MSLETLLEAARYVEQQELRAKQIQLQQSPHHLHQIPARASIQVPPAAAFKIISPVPISTHHTLISSAPQLSKSPPAALVPVSLVQPFKNHQQIEVITSTTTTAASHANGIQIGIPQQHQQQQQQQSPTPLLPPPLPPQTTTLQIINNGVQQQQQQQQQSPQTGIEFIPKPPPTIPLQPSQPVLLTNGFEKPQLITEDTQQQLIQNQGQQQTQIVQAGAIQDSKKRQPIPSVIRYGTREVHNKLEKNRRAHLKECFELLKKQIIPQQDEKKCSNLSILHAALRYIQVLKKKEREHEHEMERLAREKIASQQRLATLKKELGPQWDNIDLNSLIPEVHIKEERMTDTEDVLATKGPTTQQTLPATTAQLSMPIPLSQVGFPVSQGLVVGLHKVALVSKSLPQLVSSPVTHIITAPSQLNGKVVPLMNAQYLMKPVVVVSTPSAPAATAISPRPS